MLHIFFFGINCQNFVPRRFAPQARNKISDSAFEIDQRANDIEGQAIDN